MSKRHISDTVCAGSNALAAPEAVVDAASRMACAQCGRSVWVSPLGRISMHRLPTAPPRRGRPRTVLPQPVVDYLTGHSEGGRLTIGLQEAAKALFASDEAVRRWALSLGIAARGQVRGRRKKGED